MSKLKLVGKLMVTVGEGKDLTDVATLGSMDVFVRVECGAEKFSTKVHKSGGKKPKWDQSFVFNCDGKELDRVHFHVYSKGLITDTAIGRCDIPIDNLLKAKDLQLFQLNATTDFSKIAGYLALSSSFTGTGAPAAPLPSLQEFTAAQAAGAAAAAAAGAAAAAIPVAAPAPAVVYAGAAGGYPGQIMYQPQPQPMYGAQVMYQPQPQIVYQQPPVTALAPLAAAAPAVNGLYGPAPVYGSAAVGAVAAAAAAAQPKVIMAAPTHKCSASNKQSGWRWCSRCQVLWYAGYNNSLGVCAAGGGHNYQGSGAYHAPLQSGIGCNGQAGWKWCCRCMGMFYGAAVSVCPAGGQHDASGSGDYTMCLGNVHGQYGWGWCSRCGVFWYTANKASSYCPAGGNHSNQGSGNYQLGHD